VRVARPEDSQRLVVSGKETGDVRAARDRADEHRPNSIDDPGVEICAQRRASGEDLRIACLCSARSHCRRAAQLTWRTLRFGNSSFGR
jgi:hypothetical protein